MASQNREHWPLWVRLGLWGLPTRAVALAFFWLSIALAAAGVVGGFWHWWLFVGVGFLLSAWWYWAAVRWVDVRDEWRQSS
jgi:hypothetical protein